MDINGIGNHQWDDEVDVIVVGFGGAGACAAIEAVDNGASVMVVERFCGGGATRMSGGVIYAGGGTWIQKEAGFEDTPENMFNYLKQETKSVVSDETLKRFCQESEPTITWLEKQGVPFNSTVCPYKTSYPIDKYFLYYSGNESFTPYKEKAEPAPRGHRAHGKGMPGSVFYNPLRESAARKGVDIRYHSKAKQLITDDDGNVIGLEFKSIPKGGGFALLHKFTDWLAYKMRYITIATPHFENIFKVLSTLLELRGRTYRVKARKGVVLSAGGFVFNRKMISEYAPKYLPGATLGTIGDDGSAINMGRRIGAAVDRMDRVSAWRFINPPQSFVKGVLVDRNGERFCNEMLYGAKTAELMVEEHMGVGILIIDSEIWKRAHRDLHWDRAQWFQAVPALLSLYLNDKKANTIEDLAVKCNIPPAKLSATIDAYNEAVRSSKEDVMGKPSDFVKELKPPFHAIDCSLGNLVFACATITLGGLVVDEETGEVKRKDGSIISGLYAAGRSAVGVTSNGYMSGLSIADAVFSGRRSGNHAALKGKEAAAEEEKPDTEDADTPESTGTDDEVAPVTETADAKE